MDKNLLFVSTIAKRERDRMQWMGVLEAKGERDVGCVRLQSYLKDQFIISKSGRTIIYSQEII